MTFLILKYFGNLFSITESVPLSWSCVAAIRRFKVDERNKVSVSVADIFLATLFYFGSGSDFSAR